MSAIRAIRKTLRPVRRLAEAVHTRLVELPYLMRTPARGSADWLIRSEVAYGGLVTDVARRRVSSLDTRSPEQLATGGMTGGDRMLHHGYAESYASYLAPLLGEQSLTVAEFGIPKGTGLAIWCDLFRSARVIGFVNEMLIAFFADKGGTYVDVGANVGLTTIPVAQNPRVSCLALEPEPGNFSFLRANIAANCPHGNVVAKRVAVFECPDTLRFEIASDNLGDHRIRLRDVVGQMNEQERTTIEVDALPLDDLLQVKDRPAAVKVDTQGSRALRRQGRT